MGWKVYITDLDLENDDIERELMASIGASLERHQCRTEDEVIKVCGDADALLVQYAPITRRVIDALPQLKAISRYGIGVDMVDLNAAEDRGIPVSNVPHYCTEEVATHAFAMLLASARKLVPLHKSVEKGRWTAVSVAQPIRRLRGQYLGIVGGGQIGTTLARMAMAVGMEVIVHDPYAVRDWPEVTYVGWDDILSTSDYISIHCPLNSGTAGMFNEWSFKKMKSSAVLINTSRGGIVVTSALKDALRQGEIGGAALDVLAEEPPAAGDIPGELQNLIVTPHAAWYSEDALVELQRLTAQAIVDFFETGYMAAIANPRE